jgi:hypothetical protein
LYGYGLLRYESSPYASAGFCFYGMEIRRFEIAAQKPRGIFNMKARSDPSCATPGRPPRPRPRRTL